MIPFHAQFSVLQNVHMGLVLVIFYLICGSTLSSHMGWSHFHALWLVCPQLFWHLVCFMDGGKLFLLGIPKDQIKFQLSVFLFGTMD